MTADRARGALAVLQDADGKFICEVPCGYIVEQTASTHKPRRIQAQRRRRAMLRRRVALIGGFGRLIRRAPAASATSIRTALCTTTARTAAAMAFARFVILNLLSWYLTARTATEIIRYAGEVEEGGTRRRFHYLFRHVRRDIGAEDHNGKQSARESGRENLFRRKPCFLRLFPRSHRQRAFRKARRDYLRRNGCRGGERR